jgi:hypothetical protein
MAKKKVATPPRSIDELTREASMLLTCAKNQVRGAEHFIDEAAATMARARDHRT